MIRFLDEGITAVPGFLAAGVRIGIKRKGPDLMLLVNEGGPVPAAGAFTTNLVKGAPVQITAKHVKDGKLAAVVANSGIANAYTGKRGLKDAIRMAKIVAKHLKLEPTDVGVASTGLIGAPLPMDRIENGIKKAIMRLSSSRISAQEAARAIMTTDTKPKELSVKVRLEDGTDVTIAGIAKGSGMIRPKLEATMLAFIVTDAAITPGALRAALRRSVNKSFNMLNVDQETSTNDMVLIMANGRAGNREITLRNPSERFQKGLDCVTTGLARMIARDGEGASHLIEVQIKGAKTEEDARKAALAVVGSNLVKAAVFGRDPNWGRIIAALGYSGASFDPSKITLKLASRSGEVTLIKRGAVATKETIERASELLRDDEIKIYVNLAAGKAEAAAWGCDLTYDYVRINSSYTT
ncbi:MAG: bifunctional ornithine acetyltransferase/N-acetylglutamate synthase [Hadesarchaea archaeon]|nr:bifunctional ornithine acetyltransferase/N-acetylglutamate synthase [Hadesarchaea archaeon]